MKLSEIYEKNKFRKYAQVEEITNDITLKARVKYLLDKNKKLAIIIFSIILIIILITFHSNIQALGLVLLMLTMLSILTIYFNTSTIICKNNKMTIKMNMQEIQIEYSKLKNVYLENKKSRIYLKKRNSFWLIILYETPNRNISSIYIPTIFLNTSDVEKFLNTFKVKTEKSNNNIVKAQKYQLKRLLIKTGIFILVWAVILLTILFH